MEPSLIDYARFHGIANDYTAIDPLEHIDDTFRIDSQTDAWLEEFKSEYETRLRDALVTLDDRLRREKIKLPKKSAQYLMSIIRESQAKAINIEWDDILPAFAFLDNSKFEPPIFTLERGSDGAISRWPLYYSFDDPELHQLLGSCQTADIATLPPSLRTNDTSLAEQIRREKLKCTKGAFSFLQSIMSDRGPTGQELEVAVGALLKINAIDLFESGPPALLPLGSADFLPPSPTPVPDENMLPSPASSVCTEADFGKQLQIMSSAGAEDLGNDPRRVDAQSFPISSSSSNNFYNRDKSPVPDNRAEDFELSVNKASITPQKNGGKSDTNIFNPDPPMTTDNRTSTAINVKLPLPEIASLAPHQVIPTKMYQHQPLRVSSEHSSQLAYTVGRSSQPETLPKKASASLNELWAVRRNTAPPQKSPLEGLYDPNGIVKSTRPHQQRVASKLPRVNLGSLSSFMETRGKGTKREIAAESPYFATDKENGSEEHDTTTHSPGSRHQPASKVSFAKPIPTPLLPTSHVPRTPAHHEGLVLLISTSLLKSNLRVIQCLEGANHPPKLVYRDYTQAPNPQQTQPRASAFTSQYKQAAGAPPPEEADIILSPKTGVILTTSQATMQQYLPGHKSVTILQNTPKSVNSPLREQIFRLSTRYEQLYIFISHCGKNPPRKPKTAGPQIEADKRTLASFVSLSAFCSSLLEYAAITPQFIPPGPESAASWILALAHKHACQFPAPKPQCQYSMAFTPVNPKPQVESLLGSMKESVWELFLRRMGLKPYAAQVVLAVLRRERSQILNADDFAAAEPCPGSLSDFVEMSSEKRRVLFGQLLGERTLRRVDALIEKDWQCDWALNFEATVD
ncbi:hypothetical protein BJX61DRAFT_539790 [Aspergillus egyptiacus]|nr:hypothetical protein BJX61DRAFT_539790 [Aspergillus egyptiacus]